MPVQIDSRLYCKMCQCTVYAVLTVRLYSLITVLIHNSGHFGPPGIAGAADGQLRHWSFIQDIGTDMFKV